MIDYKSVNQAQSHRDENGGKIMAGKIIKIPHDFANSCILTRGESTSTSSMIRAAIRPRIRIMPIRRWRIILPLRGYEGSPILLFAA
jgi:hypothetical protein